MRAKSIIFLDFVPVEFYEYFKTLVYNCVREMMHLIGRLSFEFLNRSQYVRWPFRPNVVPVLTSSLTELITDNE